MTMDATAITKIAELISAGQELNTHVPAVVIPAGNKVESLELLQANPSRLRQVFKTERLHDFIGYVAAHGDVHTTTYVAPDGASACAIIDHGTHDDPEWGSHVAHLKLVKTGAYLALEKLGERPRSQQELIDYLEDWAHPGAVDCLVDGEPVSPSTAIAAIRRVEIGAKATSTHEQGDFRASRTAIEEIEAKAAAGTMPGHIRLTGPVYVGTDERQVYARIGITPIDEKPAFRVRIMQADAMQEAIAAQVEERLHLELECGVFVGHVTR